MKKQLQTEYQTRQHMVSDRYEVYYYQSLQFERVDWHQHDFYEFYLFLEGEVRMEIDGHYHVAAPGDIFLIPPHHPHGMVNLNPDIPYRRFVIWLSKNFCDDLAGLSEEYMYLFHLVQDKKVYQYHTDTVSFNELQSKIIRMLEEMQSNNFGKDAQLSLLINDLILHINRMVYADLHPISPSATDSLFDRLLLYIQNNLDEDLSLERLAHEFYVSKYHIAHLFKEKFGMSIHQYITKKRLERCKQALLGDENITDIYESFGFGDYSSFFRAFKKEYGISPKEFRDMQHEKIIKPL